MQLKSLFPWAQEKGTLDGSLRLYLDDACQKLQASEETTQDALLFLERLSLLVQSEDRTIARLTVTWVIEDLIKHHRLPESIHSDVFSLIQQCQEPWLAPILLDWPSQLAPAFQKPILAWLATLDYDNEWHKQKVIETLYHRHLSTRTDSKVLIETLKTLDTQEADVTSYVLHHFPSDNLEHNRRMIQLLGETGRFRVIKPLVRFAREYPEYLRPITKALRKFAFDDVDQFYMDCLDNRHREQPAILLEAVRQIRKRRLRKAIPKLEALFPLDETIQPLVDRAVNGEIALTMASFGVYVWGRESLIPQMILNGINRYSLQAVDILGLEEAVPLLKALMLAPETPEISVIQHQAYPICQRLLMASKCVL